MRQQVASVSGDPLEQAHWGGTTIVIASHRAFKGPSGEPAVEMQRATEGPGVLSKGAAIVGNLWSPLVTGSISCWRRARDLMKTFCLLGGHHADNLVPMIAKPEGGPSSDMQRYEG